MVLQVNNHTVVSKYQKNPCYWVCFDETTAEMRSNQSSLRVSYLLPHLYALKMSLVRSWDLSSRSRCVCPVRPTTRRPLHERRIIRSTRWNGRQPKLSTSFGCLFNPPFTDDDQAGLFHTLCYPTEKWRDVSCLVGYREGKQHTP